MIVDLYISKSEKVDLNKNISFVKKVNCKPYDNLSMTEPKLSLDKSQILIPDFNKINYMYIPEFGYYYTLNSFILKNGGLVEISGTIDVLFSFNSEIKNLYCLIARQENIKNEEIVDTNILLKASRKQSIKKANVVNAFVDDCYYLTVSGGY